MSFGEIAPRTGGGARAVLEVSNTINPVSWFAGINTIVCGPGAAAMGAGSIVIGAKAAANGYDAVVIGRNANTTALEGIVIGRDAVVTAASGIAIGRSASVTGTSSLAIGIAATANTFSNCVALGASATTNGGNNSISIGVSSAATGVECTVIGWAAQSASANQITMVGSQSYGGAADTAAFGFSAFARSAGSLAIGSGAATPASSAGINSIALGYNAYVDGCSELALGLGRFSTGGSGTAKCSIYQLWMQTTNATVTELKGGSASNTPTSIGNLQGATTRIYDIDIVARKSTTGTDYSAWNLKFCINIEASAATCAIVGTVTKTLIGQTGGASAWDVSATADITNGRANISVTGQASTTIRWVACVKVTQVQG